MENMIPWTR